MKKAGSERFAELWGRYRFAALTALAGVVLLAWPFGGGREDTSAPAAAPTQTEAEALAETEARMAAILSKIQGAGQLSLMLTLDRGEEQQLASDTELSYSGATAAPDDYTRRTETVVFNGSGGDAPLVTRRDAPAYRGAVVVCQGAGDAQVRLAVTEAVSALTGLGTDRVAVIKCQ